MDILFYPIVEASLFNLSTIFIQCCEQQRISKSHHGAKHLSAGLISHGDDDRWCQGMHFLCPDDLTTRQALRRRKCQTVVIAFLAQVVALQLAHVYLAVFISILEEISQTYTSRNIIGKSMLRLFGHCHPSIIWHHNKTGLFGYYNQETDAVFYWIIQIIGLNSTAHY